MESFLGVSGLSPAHKSEMHGLVKKTELAELFFPGSVAGMEFPLEHTHLFSLQSKSLGGWHCIDAVPASQGKLKVSEKRSRMAPTRL